MQRQRLGARRERGWGQEAGRRRRGGRVTGQLPCEDGRSHRAENKPG
ncbi:hypothetical protein T261_8187 [Streptomyces lydicus]|nr:hypothetical protein T261_8187 [Streptomyces lydicus]